MDAELKTLLTVLLDKVERVEAQMPNLATKTDITRLEGRIDGLEGRIDGLDARMGGLDGRMGGLESRMDRMEGEFRTFKDEQRQMKEMLGNMRLKEIARLDGRIDQLAMDVALGRKPAAE